MIARINQDRILTFSIFTIGTILSIFFFISIQSVQKERNTHVLKRLAQQEMHILLDEMYKDIYILDAFYGLYSASDNVTYKDFTSFATDLKLDKKHVYAVQYLTLENGKYSIKYNYPNESFTEKSSFIYKNKDKEKNLIDKAIQSREKVSCTAHLQVNNEAPTDLYQILYTAPPQI